jgi:hypothetical protein
MTLDQKLDRLERSLTLLLERPCDDLRESRKQVARLGDYVTALREYDALKQILETKPDDSETAENVRKAKEALDRAREALRR